MVTWLRVFMTPFVVYVNYIEWYSLGIPLFLFAAFTDAVDGSLARTRNQITNFGKIFDPLADKLLVGTMVVLLVFRYLDPYLGYVIIGTEILFILLALVLHLRGKVTQANIWGKIKMALQVVAVSLILLGLVLGSPLLFTAAAWVFGAAIVFSCVSLFFYGI